MASISSLYRCNHRYMSNMSLSSHIPLLALTVYLISTSFMMQQLDGYFSSSGSVVVWGGVNCFPIISTTARGIPVSQVFFTSTNDIVARQQRDSNSVQSNLLKTTTRKRNIVKRLSRNIALLYKELDNDDVDNFDTNISNTNSSIKSTKNTVSDMFGNMVQANNDDDKIEKVEPARLMTNESNNNTKVIIVSNKRNNNNKSGEQKLEQGEKQQLGNIQKFIYLLFDVWGYIIMTAGIALSIGLVLNILGYAYFFVPGEGIVVDTLEHIRMNRELWNMPSKLT